MYTWTIKKSACSCPLGRQYIIFWNAQKIPKTTRARAHNYNILSTLRPYNIIIYMYRILIRCVWGVCVCVCVYGVCKQNNVHRYDAPRTGCEIIREHTARTYRYIHHVRAYYTKRWNRECRVKGVFLSLFLSFTLSDRQTNDQFILTRRWVAVATAVKLATCECIWHYII